MKSLRYRVLVTLGNLASVIRNKHINGTELAKQLGIDRSTLNRWVEAERLPKPEKSISGMLPFERSAVGVCR